MFIHVTYISRWYLIVSRQLYVFPHSNILNTFRKLNFVKRYFFLSIILEILNLYLKKLMTYNFSKKI